MNVRKEFVFLEINEALDLVERIADRAADFNHNMTKSEKQAMADYLSEVGVLVSDLVDISNLADNYAINAELVTPEEIEEYGRLEDALFTWEESDGVHACLSW